MIIYLYIIKITFYTILYMVKCKYYKSNYSIIIYTYHKLDFLTQKKIIFKYIFICCKTLLTLSLLSSSFLRKKINHFFLKMHQI